MHLASLTILILPSLEMVDPGDIDVSKSWKYPVEKLHECEVPRGNPIDVNSSELVPNGRNQPFYSGNQLLR